MTDDPRAPLESLKVYIASPYPLRDRAVSMMHVLELKGVTVTSRWLKAPDEMNDFNARKDLEDVAAADVLLALNPDGWEDKGTGGRHVELGYALALGKPVLLVGERSNIFHHLACVTQIDEMADFQKHLKSLTVLRQGTPASQTQPSKRWTEILCTRCGGNGVVRIPGGVSTCDRCDGRCYEPLLTPQTDPQGSPP